MKRFFAWLRKHSGYDYVPSRFMLWETVYSVADTDTEGGVEVRQGTIQTVLDDEFYTVRWPGYGTRGRVPGAKLHSTPMQALQYELSLVSGKRYYPLYSRMPEIDRQRRILLLRLINASSVDRPSDDDALEVTE